MSNSKIHKYTDENDNMLFCTPEISVFLPSTEAASIITHRSKKNTSYKYIMLSYVNRTYVINTMGSRKNKLPFSRTAIFVEIKASRLAG